MSHIGRLPFETSAPRRYQRLRVLEVPETAGTELATTVAGSSSTNSVAPTLMKSPANGRTWIRARRLAREDDTPQTRSIRCSAQYCAPIVVNTTAAQHTTET